MPYAGTLCTGPPGGIGDPFCFWNIVYRISIQPSYSHAYIEYITRQNPPWEILSEMVGTDV